MTKSTQPLQESFHAGEISPNLRARVQSPGYQAGVETMKNFIADSRGPATRRRGIQFVSEQDGNDARLYYFLVNESTAYVLLFTDLLLKPLTPDGVEQVTNHITNPRFRDGGTDWTTILNNGSVQFLPDNCSITVDNNNNSSAAITQTPVTPVSAIFRMTTTSSTTIDYRVTIGTAGNATAYADQLVVGGGDFSFLVDLLGDLGPVINISNSVRNTTVEINAAYLTETSPATGFITPYPEVDLPLLHFIPAPGGETIYVTHPNYPTYKVVYDYTTDLFVWGEVTFTSPPAQWAGTNYPRTGVFHQGRLWLGGTPEQPQTFWASKSGLPEDFTVGALDDDSLQFTIAKLGDIRWMESTKNLLIGSTLGEHIVTSEGGVITPGDISVDQQSAYGATGIQPVHVGDQVFYISPDATKVRAMQYEWTSDNWLSNDITFFSNHITASGIRFVAWAQNPDNLFMCVLNDGTIAMVTYERGEDVYGWHRHDVGGKVLDIVAGSRVGVDGMVIVVQRVDGKINIEGFSRTNTAYMDSWVRDSSDTPLTTLAGLDHLEGQTLAVVGDGAVQPDQVVSGGAITLATPANEVYAGVPYTSTLKTLPLDKGSRTGSAQPYQKRYSKIIVTIADSAHPIINGTRQAERHPSTPMDTAEPQITERSEVYNLGWDKEAIVTIEQDLPVPCKVLSIAGELDQNMAGG